MQPAVAALPGSRLAPRPAEAARCAAQLSQLGAFLASQQPVGSVEDAFHVATALRVLPRDVLLVTPAEGPVSLAAPVSHDPPSRPLAASASSCAHASRPAN